jgi:imidazolonepropionase-like amidohydrolase
MSWSSRSLHPVVLALLASVGCASTRHVVELEAQEPATIVDVSVIDGTGAAPVLHQDVVIAGDRVVAIRPTGEPVSGRRIDGHGQTLLPGFVDAHVHVAGDGALSGHAGLTAEENLERWLRMGVTTVFDMGGAAADLEDFGARVDEGTLASPRLFHTNLVITGTDSYPIGIADEVMGVPGWLVRLVLPQVGDEEDIAAVLDDVDLAGADYVKIMVDRMPEGEPLMPRPLLQALIRAARARHYPVFVHAGHTDDAVAAAEAGATALAHLPRRGRFTPEQVRTLKGSGVVVVSTASMWEATTDVLEGRFVPSPLDELLVPAAMREALIPPPDSPVLHSVQAELAAQRDNRRENLRDLIKAGVPVVVGTDSPLSGTWAGSSHPREMSSLLAAGLTPMQLIVAMTSLPASLLGGGFGTVAAGRQADLVLVPGDPLQDPSVLATPSMVMIGGRLVTPVPATATLPPTPMSGTIVMPTDGAAAEELR